MASSPFPSSESSSGENSLGDNSFSSLGIDMISLHRDMAASLKKKPMAMPGHVRDQRDTIRGRLPQDKKRIAPKSVVPKEGGWIFTGIPGVDSLLDKGIPKGLSILVCGGPGSGKTIFCLQTAAYAASHGEKCLYLTFEESEDRLKNHMDDFGWEWKAMEKKGSLLIKRFSPFDITRQVEAMLEKARGELLIDVKPLLFPDWFVPDRIVVDSLSAIAAAFVGKEETYRIYVEQLFKLFEEIGATSFLISESTDVVHHLTASGVEEFLADGVIVMYNFKRGNVRENALEILKIRGAKFQKKIAAMQITSEDGIVVYPAQEVFSEEGQ
ncbi:AAA family ATPase [Candidatus Woesearchaeota archaeon]|nr:AAA family ATPase [Candidatus Woesearchaeota archaeon]